MADLFISYAREDRECTERLARVLESHGWSVWWDRRIQVGRSFSEVIEQELAEARCLIVLWSQHSVKSDWVQAEAAEAQRRRILVPVRIEDVPLPFEFRRLHSADLFDWRRGFDSQAFADCVASIESLVRRTLPEHIPEPDAERATNAEIWISQDGQEFCAPDAATLRAWAAEGRLRADSLVYDGARWIRAQEMAELRGVFPVAPSPAPVTAKKPSAVRYTVIALAAIVLLGIIIAMSLRTPEHTATDTAATETSMTADTATSTVPAAQAVSVSLRNNCADKDIAVAICYLNASNVWTSSGWYSVRSGETSPNVLNVMGPVVYFHAVSGALSWGAAGNEELKRMAPVHRTNAFSVNADDKLGGDYTYVSFFGRTADQQAYTQNFGCD